MLDQSLVSARAQLEGSCVTPQTLGWEHSGIVSGTPAIRWWRKYNNKFTNDNGITISAMHVLDTFWKEKSP